MMDYEKELLQLKHCRESEMHGFKLKYAESFNHVKVGDKIEDHRRQGIVKYWKLSSMDSRRPKLVYICDILTKAGNPNKRSPTGLIYQSDLEKINGTEWWRKK